MAKLHSEIRTKAVDITTAEGAASNFAQGDVIYDTDSSEFKIHDGTTWQDALSPGGGGIASVSADTNPQLGGDLDGQAFDITTTGKILYANVYTDEVDLPSAATYHGMFAHVHNTGKAYYAHGGNWIKLQNEIANTDGLAEGTTNLYFTNARADARIQGASLSDLSDIASGATDGQVLKWNNAASEWQPGDEAGGGASNLSGLSDVLTDAPADGHILQYVGGNNRFENLAFSDVARKKYFITETGGNYRITGPGLDGGDDNPDIYLVRGESYSFTNNAGAAHPFDIENTNNTAYSDSGLGSNSLNNGEATNWIISMDSPAQLQYQCSNHAGMKGNIYILDESGGTGASDKIEDGAGGTLAKAQAAGNQVEFFTSNSHRWSITSAGHFLPNTHDAFDIGSAEKKVRDLYVSDSSIWIGDKHKLAINSEGEMLFLKRKVGRIPSGANVEDDTIEKIRTQGGLAGDKTLDNMTLNDWRQYASARGIGMHQLYDKDETLDWENVESDNVIQKAAAPATSTAIARKFHVAVDNKDPNAYPEAGGSGNAYYIDGRHAPELRLRKGTYRFYQRHFSNDTHPLVFRSDNASNGHEELPVKLWYGYTDVTDPANPAEIRQSEYDGSSWVFNTTPYGDGGLTFDPTNANWEHYVDLTITDATPREFYYACGAHSKMGWKIINESAAIGGGATNANDLSDISTGGVQDGEALVYNDGNSRFEPQPILQDLHNQFADRRIDFQVHQVKEMHSTLKNNFGGRIVIDLDIGGANEFDSGAGDKLQLDLSQLYDMSPMPKTMNFEIFSRGTDPFTVELANPASGPTTGAQVLQSDIQSPISVNEDATATISIGEGQMLVIYCSGASWYYEIRSGL